MASLEFAPKGDLFDNEHNTGKSDVERDKIDGKIFVITFAASEEKMILVI